MNAFARIGEQIAEFLPNEQLDIFTDFSVEEALSHSVDNLSSCRSANIRKVKRFLKFDQKLIVDPTVSVEEIDEATKNVARLREARFDFGK